MEGWRQFCGCGAVFTGGEMWEGMAAEAGHVGNLAWFRAAAGRRGTLETELLGWWFCLLCGARAEKPPFIARGCPKGGFCDRCIETARARLTGKSPLWRLAAAWKTCSLCLAPARRPVARIAGNFYFCLQCLRAWRLES
jgi:hypothetical protein